MSQPLPQHVIDRLEEDVRTFVEGAIQAATGMGENILVEHGARALSALRRLAKAARDAGGGHA